MRLSFVAAVAAVTLTSVFAQSNQGTITGAISDPTGAVVPAAQIEVKNAETGVVYRGGTSASGNYVIAAPAGTYEITVNATGFKKSVQQNVPVIVATDTRKDIVLEVGAASEVVTVNAEAPLLKTESGEMSHRVTIDDLDNLPVLTLAGGGFTGATASGNIRNPLAASTLLPGVTFANDNTLVVNGLPSNSEAIRVEGQDSTSTLWKVYQQLGQNGVDAIQEVAVQTSNFAAEYGQVGGGYFNFTISQAPISITGALTTISLMRPSTGDSRLPMRERKTRPRPASTSGIRSGATITVSRSAGRFGFPSSMMGATAASSFSTSNNTARTAMC